MVSQRAISTRRSGASVSYLEVGNNGALNDKSSDSSVRRTCYAAWHRWPRNHVEPIQVHLVRGEASCTHTRKLHGVNRRRRKRTSRTVGEREGWPRVGKTTIDEDERVHRQCRFDGGGRTEKEEDEETERERDYGYETRSKRKRETEDTRGKKEERSGADGEREIRDKTRKKWGSRDRKDEDENTRKEDDGGGTTCL